MRYQLTLDADKGEGRFAVTREIVIRQGDALSYELDIDVRQGGEEFDLRGYSVRLYATKPDGSPVIDGENLAVTDARTGRLVYTVPQQLVDTVGTVAPCYLRITDAQNADEYSLSTDSFRLKVVKGVGASLASGEYVPEIDGLLADMDKQLSDYSQAEDARASAEASRETEEQARVEAERMRREAEEARLANEERRTGAEDDRAAAESLRATAEGERAAAEAARAAEFAVFEAKAQEWVPRILVEGEYDPITRKPTLAAGEFCTVYMAPSADTADGNEYDEYMWVPDSSEAGGHFEKLGASSVDFPAATADEVAGILDGSVTQGGAGITVTAMAALKEGFDGAYAPGEHSHAVADVDGLRGELDGLDASIGKLPTFADVPKVNIAQQAVAATIEQFESNGANCVRMTAHDADGVQRGIQVEDTGVIRMTRREGTAGSTATWSLPVNNVVMDWRGSATDLSYTALHSLAPGMYLVSSTAANQPISGHGDANMLVGRAASNRVWALLCYNTGVIYVAYGYEHQGSTANWGWVRIDNGLNAQRQRGTISDASFANLYALSVNPGTYLMANNAANNPSSGNYCNVYLSRSAGNRMVCIAVSDSGAVYTVKGYEGTWAWVRIDVNGTSGVLPVSRGGTGCTAVNSIIATLFPDYNPDGAWAFPVFGTNMLANGYIKAADLRSKIGLGSSTGALAVANGGTGATTATAARTNLGISASANTGNYYYRIKVGGVQVVCMYLHCGGIDASHTFSTNTFTIPWPFTTAPNVVASGSFFFGSENGKNVNVEGQGTAVNQLQVRTYGNPGYYIGDFVVTAIAMGPCA